MNAVADSLLLSLFASSTPSAVQTAILIARSRAGNGNGARRISQGGTGATAFREPVANHPAFRLQAVVPVSNRVAPRPPCPPPASLLKMPPAIWRHAPFYCPEYLPLGVRETPSGITARARIRIGGGPARNSVTRKPVPPAGWADRPRPSAHFRIRIPTPFTPGHAVLRLFFVCRTAPPPLPWGYPTSFRAAQTYGPGMNPDYPYSSGTQRGKTYGDSKNTGSNPAYGEPPPLPDPYESCPTRPRLDDARRPASALGPVNSPPVPGERSSGATTKKKPFPLPVVIARRSGFRFLAGEPGRVLLGWSVPAIVSVARRPPYSFETSSGALDGRQMPCKKTALNNCDCVGP